MQFSKKLIECFIKVPETDVSNLESKLYLIYQILHQYFTSKESEPKKIKINNFQFSILDGDDESETEQKTKKALEMLNKVNATMTLIDIIKLKNEII